MSIAGRRQESSFEKVEVVPSKGSIVVSHRQLRNTFCGYSVNLSGDYFR
jgi:hypothetical protein